MPSGVRHAIELLDDRGSFVHVAFTEMQPPNQFLPGHGSMVYGTEVEAQGGGIAPYVSRWWLSHLAGLLWERRLGPQDPDERKQWYMRGTIRSYRIDIAEIGRVRLSGLSDGYLTTLGWVADMIARWAKYARDAGHTLDASFARKMPAVVLIDEIDMHLHPAWQTRVIAGLRESFPMTTFIATTHNPETLRGFEADEIVRLELDEDGRVFPLRPQTSPKLKTGSELYETFFGIDGHMPPERGGVEKRRPATNP